MAQKAYVYVTPFFPSAENWRGGFSLDAVRALKRAGWKVEVFVGCSRRDGETSGDYEYEGVKVHRFPRLVAPCELFPFAVEGRNVRSFLRSFAAAGLRAEDVEVVHANTVFFAAYAAALKAANPKAVAALQHHFSPPFHLRAGRLGEVPVHATLLYRHWRKRCGQMDVQVFTSERTRLSYAQDEQGVDLRRHLFLGRGMRGFAEACGYVLYNGVDARAFCPSDERSVRNGEPFVIGCVANFFPGKGQLPLLRAVDRIRSCGKTFRVRLVGSGETRADCERFAAERGLDVEFLPEMKHLNLPTFYRSLDLYVLPSTYAEGFNCTCAEAFACGVPVMGYSSVPCLDEGIVRDRERWIALPHDEARLAEMIRLQAISPIRQEFAVDYDIDHIMARWTNWLLARTGKEGVA